MHLWEKKKIKMGAFKNSVAPDENAASNQGMRYLPC